MDQYRCGRFAMIFEWDASKAKINLQKHKVSFEEAKTIFTDPFLLTYPDERHSQDGNGLY